MEKDIENNFDQVTEEPVKSISIKNAFYVVLALHVVAIIGIAYFGSAKKAKADDRKLLLEEPVYVGVAEPTPTPIPEPEPTPVASSSPWPQATPELKTYPNTKKAIPVVKEKASNYTKEYIVKSGDTFYSIVRKYKLNPERLKKLNNITNENKIQAGQKLKLM